MCSEDMVVTFARLDSSFQVAAIVKLSLIWTLWTLLTATLGDLSRSNSIALKTVHQRIIKVMMMMKKEIDETQRSSIA